jgi:hypothetical protein
VISSLWRMMLETGDAVGDGRVLLPSQRDTSELCDQRLAAVAFDPGLQALAQPSAYPKYIYFPPSH